MTTGPFDQSRIYVAVCILAAVAALAPPRARSQELEGTAVVDGFVRDSSRRPLANATVFLVLGSPTQAAPTQVTQTDSEGRYRFEALRPGSYNLRAEMTGYDSASAGPRNLEEKETTEVDLFLTPAKPSGRPSAAPAKPATEMPRAQVPELFDEPRFTVAGVTQATNSGGHGSDVAQRTTEALAKATVSLGKESDASSRTAASVKKESSLRSALARDPENFEAIWQLGKFLAENEKAAEAVPFLERAIRLNPGDPESHHLLGYVEEKLGNPLQAVREYQRASELDPSEPHLFDWGTELLEHRALEPAIEVLTKGNRLFPKSLRMLVALGVAWYARGSYDQATRYLVNASDLAPDNPTPYLFLGKMQSVEISTSEGSRERLARFAQMHPDNALANYYYAVSLWKQEAGSADTGNERSAQVEALLTKAVHFDSKLGAAYLQLGILYAQRGDFSRAISAFQQAIEVSREEIGPERVNPELDETLEESHYRLAQAYLRTGDKVRAQAELEFHDHFVKKTKEDTERARREMQQFVISLRHQDSVSQ